jgi:ABC-2 type transport system ATP-binding protein
MADTAPAHQLQPALQVSGLSHAFGPVKALRDVSFVVPKGAFVALLGINGAGKTTLFSLITRLYDSTSGTIRVAGHDARRAPGQALARLGVVFQSRALDADLSLRQNLHYHASLHGIGRRDAALRIAELLGQVELTEKADARVATLSGGQQRRAEIARALLHRPQLLLLDEATAGLDVRARAEVQALVRRLIRDEGVSTLWSTHAMDEIAPEDHVIILHDGAILAQGKAAEISRAEGLKESFLRLTGAAA